jgi:TonB family protein
MKHAGIAFSMKTSVLLSLGLHILFALGLPFLFPAAPTRERHIQVIRVSLASKGIERNPATEIVSSRPLRNRGQEREQRELGSLKAALKQTPFEAPKPLPVARSEEEPLEPFAGSLVSAQPAAVSSKEAQPSITLRDFSPGTDPPPVPSVSSPSFPGNSAGDAEISLPGKGGGSGPGEEGGNEARGGPLGRGNGDGPGSGLSAYGEAREGRPGGNGGGGSGSGSAAGGGPSRKGGGLWGKLFSSSGGNGASQPRYAENPKPPYPSEAKEKGYQGEVLLKVEVLTTGKVGQIEIKRSSGHEILDQSALSTVRRWRFIPARKGEAALSTWVNVPILFKLQ